MGIGVFLFSGCRVFKVGEFRISGRVTDAEGKTGIRDVKINYKINNYAPRYTWTSSYNDSGEWSIRADEGDRVKIWAEKDNYMFSPAPYEIIVKGDRNDVNFKVSGWAEDFSDPSSRWDTQYYYDGSHQDYVTVDGGAEYEIKVVNYTEYTGFISTVSPLSVPSDYTVEATMYPVSVENSGACGLIFNVRRLENGHFYYIFRIRPKEGKAEFLKVEITGEGTSIVYSETKTNAEINSKHATITEGVNILKVIQNYNFVYLYVNGVEIWEKPKSIEVQNSDYLRVGLYASADPKPSGSPKSIEYIVRFDDFKLSAMGFTPPARLMNMSLASWASNSLKGTETNH